MGVEPTMADLQSAALATWLRRLHSCLLVSDTTPAGRYQSRQNRQTPPERPNHSKRRRAEEGARGVFPAASTRLQRFPLKIPASAIRSSVARVSPPFPNHHNAGTAMDSTCLPENLLAVLFPWRRERLVAQTGDELARQCRADLWRRLCRRGGGMSLAELRGYARAQAAGLVATEADRVLGRRHFQPLMRDRVLAAGVDQVVNMAVRDVLSGPPVDTARPIAA